MTPPAAAIADVCPNPSITTCEPELMILYWLLPKVAEGTCTGAGAVVDAVMTTVLPDGANGADTDIYALQGRGSVTGETGGVSKLFI